MSESPMKRHRAASGLPAATENPGPSSALLSAICVFALQTFAPPQKADIFDPPSSASVVPTGGSVGALSWPSQLDNRKHLLFTYGDCLLPFLLTCKAAWGLKADVLLPFSITPLGPLNRTPLTAAVIRNDLPLVRSMCEAAKGWNIDTGNKFREADVYYGGTALTYAAAKGRGEAVRMLLGAGANPAKALESDLTGLWFELLDHPSLVSEIIMSDTPQDFFPRVLKEETAVSWSQQRFFEAERFQIPELIRALYGAGTTKRDIEYYFGRLNDLHESYDGCTKREKESLRAFAEHPTFEFRHRAEAAGWSRDREWLRELAAVASRQEMVEYVFFAAALAGATDLVGRAIELGCDINRYSPIDEIQAIYLAARNKHVDVVELLAGCDGIDVDQALVAASAGGLTSLAKGLLARGADIEYFDEYDYYFGNPLCAAIERGHVATMCMLLDAGATGVRSSGGRYVVTYKSDQPFILACDWLQLEIVQVLLEQYKADVNATTESGSTALMVVASAWPTSEAKIIAQADIVRLLLERGANRDARFEGGVCENHQSAWYNNKHIADVLRDCTIGAGLPSMGKAREPPPGPHS